MAKPATVETSIMVGSSTGNITVDVPTDYDKNKAYPLIWSGTASGSLAQRFTAISTSTPRSATTPSS